MGNFFSNMFGSNKKYAFLFIISSIFYLITHTLSLSYYVKSGENALLKDQKEIKNATISSLVFSIIFLIVSLIIIFFTKHDDNKWTFGTQFLNTKSKVLIFILLILLPSLFIIYDGIIINKIDKEGDKIVKDDSTYKSMIILNAVLTYIQIIIVLIALYLYYKDKTVSVKKDLCRNYEVDVYYLTSNLEDRKI